MTLSSKLRIGVVGCGAFGESHLATFAGIPFAEVTAVADLNQERARKLASRYRVPRVSKDFRELCSLPDLDAVSVVTTEDQHLEPVLSALEHGKHVFVEKPFATRLADAETMLEAARKTGLILASTNGRPLFWRLPSTTSTRCSGIQAKGSGRFAAMK